MLHGFSRFNRGVEHGQWGHRRSIRTPALVKGTTVFSSIVLLGILGAFAAFGVVSSIVVTARDGYRRMPKESFARTV